MGRAYTLARERKENIGGAEMSLNLCECGGEVDIRFGGHGAKSDFTGRVLADPQLLRLLPYREQNSFREMAPGWHGGS